MILVTDATSRVGSIVTRQLVANGHAVRALVPTLARAPRLETMSAEFVVGNLADTRTLSGALAGVQTVVLNSRNAPEQIALQEQVIALARAAGVQRIVKLSAFGSSPDACCDSARTHWRVEQALLRSGISSCTVRTARLMQTLEAQVPLLLTAGIITGCQGDGRVSDIDVRDVAGVLATLAVRTGDRIVDESLTGVTRLAGADDSTFEAIDLTGPASITRRELASMLSANLGRHISYVDCEPADLLQCAQAAGLPPWQAADLVAYEAHAANGGFDHVSPAAQTVLGRPPRDFAAFAHEFAFSVRYSQAPGRFDLPNAALLPA